MTEKDKRPGRPRPVVLCILDGWGHRDKTDDNAVTLARTPNLHRFWKYSPHALLEASEEWVGLPTGQIGNSEVGHMNLGAGRVVMQDLPRIDTALADGEFAAEHRARQPDRQGEGEAAAPATFWAWSPRAASIPTRAMSSAWPGR